MRLKFYGIGIRWIELGFPFYYYYYYCFLLLSLSLSDFFFVEVSTSRFPLFFYLYCRLIWISATENSCLFLFEITSDIDESGSAHLERFYGDRFHLHGRKGFGELRSGYGEFEGIEVGFLFFFITVFYCRSGWDIGHLSVLFGSGLV